MLHVQIGPSPLALGLLIPSTRAAGFDVCIVGRPGDESPAIYGCAGTGPEGRLRLHRVAWFVGPSTVNDLPNELLERIRSDEPLLLTCTLRDRIAERREFIEALLEMRPEGAETIFLACENAPDAVYEQISDACSNRGVWVLRTVVNRMCIERPRDSYLRRMVFAHELGEWLIEQPPRSSSILTALETVDEVRVVDDIDARLARKLWMVNGAHQALALIAWHANLRALRVVGRADELESADDMREAALRPGIIARLAYLHGAMDEALKDGHPGLTDNLDYGIEHVEAYGEHPDSIRRVLGAFRRLDLRTFIETLDIRLAEPARVCARIGRSVEPFEKVFDVFEMLAGNLDAFLDADRVRENPDAISLRDDLSAVAAYEALFDGWVPPQEARERVVRLAEALADHRP
jgi:hypothetical protein